MATLADTTETAPKRSRRAMMFGATLLPAVAITTEAGAAASMAPVHPEAELIALCNRHPALIAAFNACDQDSGPDNPDWVAYEASMDAISEARPQTLAGLQAKALAAKAEALNPDGTEQPSNTIAAHWGWDIVNDMLRLTGGAA